MGESDQHLIVDHGNISTFNTDCPLLWMVSRGMNEAMQNFTITTKTGLKKWLVQRGKIGTLQKNQNCQAVFRILHNETSRWL